jgi:hypothetical protein
MPKRLKRAALISVLFVAAGGSFRAQTLSVKPEDYPALGQTPIVLLLAPGATPRVPLRYTIAGDYKAHMDLGMTMGMSLDLPGVPAQSVQLPPMKVGADVGVTNVTPAGDVSFDFGYTSVRLDDAAGADPAVASLVQGMDTDFKNVRGSATMTSRGEARDARMDVSKVTNPQLSQMLGSIENSIQSLAIPLPEEAVGVGAKWESRQTIQANNIKIFQRTVWEVVGLDGKTVNLKATVEQAAPPQSISNPSIPAGADVSLARYSGGGAATVALHLDSLIPTSEGNTQTSVTMNVNAGGSTQQVTVGVTLKVTFAPGKM